jgi:hypothetical protein
VIAEHADNGDRAGAQVLREHLRLSALAEVGKIASECQDICNLGDFGEQARVAVELSSRMWRSPIAATVIVPLPLPVPRRRRRRSDQWFGRSCFSSTPLPTTSAKPHSLTSTA